MAQASTQATIDRLSEGFQLGDWAVYPNQNLIQDECKQVHLEPKVMKVLAYLAAHQGDVIKRDTLIDDIWHTQVSDEVLSRAISLLRTCLEDNPKTPVFIQTVPKVGYRLIHEVSFPPTAENSPVKVEVTGIATRTKITVSMAFAAVVLLLLIFVQRTGDSPAISGFTSLSAWLEFLETRRHDAAEVTSIAILPFKNLSKMGSNAYFSDGLTDELTMSLGKVRGLKVVARRSAYSFKDRPDDVPTIGRLLNVDAVLEGSVRRAGNRLAINAQLSGVSDGYLLWSESYNRPVDDAFSTRVDISSAVVQALKKKFPNSRIQPPSVVEAQPDIQAYRLYLNGRFLWKLRGEKALRKSIQLFQQAVTIDPQFIRARLALANSMVLLPFYSAEPMQKMFSKALKVLQRLNFTDDWERGEAEAIQGFIAMHRWHWVEAEIRFRKAIELAPENANVYVWYSQHLSSVGRNKDAVTVAKRAEELDQVSPVVHDRLAIAYLWVNDDLRAAEQFATGSQFGFSNRINPGYIIFLLRQKRYHEFSSVMEAIHPDPATRPVWLIENSERIFSAKNRKLALKLAARSAQEGRFVNPLLQFGLPILIGEIDQAYAKFDALTGTPDSRYLFLEFLFSKEATRFREDSRFKRLAKETGLTAYWKQFGQPDYRT